MPLKLLPAPLAREDNPVIPESNEIKRYGKISDALAAKALNYGPITHWAQGLDQLGKAFVSSMWREQERQGERAVQGDASDIYESLINAPHGVADALNAQTSITAGPQ